MNNFRVVFIYNRAPEKEIIKFFINANQAKIWFNDKLSLVTIYEWSPYNG